MSAAVHTCGLYLRGHDVHWIQAKISDREQGERPIMSGHLLEVRSEGLVIVEVQGSIYRLWNHDTDRMRVLVAGNAGEISYQPGFGLLRTASASGSYLFCVADADSPDLRPCPTSPPTGGPSELLRKAGGFSMPGPEALSWVDSLGEPSDHDDP